jgi:NADH-quinone oxidoreductase subunit G
VRIEKMPKLQTSCTIICTDGMVVTTQSEEIEKAQRSMLEFLLANHPLDCPVCDRGGECELQELTFDWGNLEERFIERKNAKAEKYLSPMVANDPQRCILCKRCTRVCDEWMGEEAIEAGNRGANTVIGTFGGWLNCSQCGNCIEVCPTGTLLDGTYRHQHRPWELTQTISTCTYCSDGCQMSLGSRGGDLVRIVARDRYVNGHNGEFLCVKGRFGFDYVSNPQRLIRPMIRKDGVPKIPHEQIDPSNPWTHFRPATWEEALDRAAHHAFGIVGIDFAFDRDRQFAERSLGGEEMADVAEGILVLVQQAILRQIDAPAHHVLPVVIARREPQHLDHAVGRRVVAIGGGVGNSNSHALAGANFTGDISSTG